MQFFDTLVLACVLALDAFLVAFSCGLVSKSWKISDGLKISCITGFFQFLMPLIGYLLFRSASFVFEKYAQSLDHWIMFIIFALLGGKIIKDSLSNEEKKEFSLSFGALVLIGIATSIDALAGGVMIYTQKLEIWESASLIGVVTFALVILGYHLSKVLSSLPNRVLGILGGGMLVLLGSKVLIQHIF